MSDEADVDTKQAAAVAGVAARSHEELRKDILAASGIFLLAFAMYLLPAMLARPLSETPEARIAVVAREMIASKNYILPTLGGEPRLNKPPLPYWLTAASAQLLSGKDGITTRVMTNATLLPPALAAAGALFLVVLYGCTVFGRAAGVISGLILGLGVLVCRYAQLGYGDMTLMFCCTWMFVSAAWIVTMPRPGFLSAIELGLALGLAILTKGHIPVLLLLGPLLIETLIRRRFNGRKVGLFALAFVISAASLWWFVEVKKQAPGAWDTMMNEAQEAVDATSHHQNDRWYYYLYQLPAAVAPWTLILAIGWAMHLTRKREPEDASGIVLAAKENLRFFVIAFVTGFIGFYAAAKQQPYYLLPTLPPLALASGYVLGQLRLPGGTREENMAWSQLAIGIFAGAVLAVFPLWPLDSMSQTSSSLASLKALATAPGWAASVPLGLFVIVLHFFCARQWVEGRPIAACGGYALAACLGLGIWSVNWAQKTQQTLALPREAPALRTKLDEMGKDVRLYGVGMSESLLTFHLERPVHSEEDLSKEPTGKTGAEAPQRTLIARRKDLPSVEKDFGLKLNDEVRNGTEAIVILPLPNDRDWPKELAPVIEAREQKKR